MKRHLALVTSLLLLSLSVLPIKINIGVADVPIGYPVHNLDTGLNYMTIQGAIDANETLNGQTILVDAGVYYENILINKSISLIGENKTTTMLNQTEPWIGSVVTIAADSAEITGFSFVSFWGTLQISVGSCSDVTISDNTISSTGVCIGLSGASNCTITHNTLLGGGLEGNNIINAEHCEGCDINDNTISYACYYGIYLYMSNHNLIRNNKMQGNGWSIYLDNSYGNVIFNNNIFGPFAWAGVEVVSSNANVVFANNMSNLGCGIEFDNDYTELNRFFHNTFEGNREQVRGPTGNNLFDSGVEGNFWSDYNGTDTNRDGIGDVPCNVSQTATDHYPLMGTFRNFTASDSDVQIISNSTISDFRFNGTAISFSVSGENSTGFCRMIIPTALMNDPFIVFVNGTEVSSNLLPISNSTMSYLYFSYTHSMQDVTIIPEFPLHFILLFLMTTIPSYIIARKKYRR